MTRIELPPRAELVKLLLSPKGTPTHVELIDAGGKVLWQASGLVEQPLGGYTVDVPSSLLPRGRGAFRTYRLERGQRVGDEVLPFEVG